VAVPRSFRARLGLIALAGFLLRAAWALWVAPESLNHTGDARFYHLTANLLADGHGYVQPLPFVGGGVEIPSSEHAPGWSLVLAAFSAAGLDSYTAHELVASAVGAATVVCAGLIGRRLGGARVGLLAACGTAAYPVFVALDGSLMADPPYALAVALCLVCAFRAVEEPSPWRSAVLGLAIGAAVLVRGEAVALLVFLLVPVVWQLRARRLVHLAVAAGVAVLAVAPWAVRNSLEFDRPVLVATEDGPVIAGANCALTYAGRDIGYWRSDCLPVTGTRNPALRSERLRRAGLEYAREHAGRLPAVLSVRLLRTAGIWQPVRHVYAAEGRTMPGRPVAVAACWLVLALGALGAWMLRSQRARLAIVLAPAALALITTVLAFGYPRFRYATDVVLIVLAAFAVERLLARRQAARTTVPASASQAQPG
jgi:hypothetical protein